MNKQELIAIVVGFLFGMLAWYGMQVAGMGADVWAAVAIAGVASGVCQIMARRTAKE